MMIIFFLSSSPPYSSSLLLCLLFLCNSQSAIGISEISEIECLEFGCCIERTRGRGVVISIYYQNLVSVCRKRHVCSARRHRVRNDVDLTSWLSWFSSLLSEQRRGAEKREERREKKKEDDADVLKRTSVTLHFDSKREAVPAAPET